MPARPTVLAALLVAVAAPGLAAGADEKTQAPAPTSPSPKAVPLPPPPGGTSRIAPLQAAGIDVAMRRLCDALAGGFERLPGSARFRRVAVLPLTEVGDDAKKHELGTVLSAEIATNLRRDQGYFVVERARLGAILAEIKMGEMGLVDPKDAPKLGKFADAQALVLGSVSLQGTQYLVNVRIVAAESAESLAAASESIDSTALVAFSRDAVVLRSRSDALYRSLLVPGWGQLYNRQPIKAGIVTGVEVGLLGTALAFHLRGSGKEDDYKAATNAADAARLRGEAQDAYRVRNGFLWAAAAGWAIQAADAWFSGVDGERLAGGAVAIAPAPRGRGLTLALAGRF